jgi:Transposase DDE domain/Transposase DNA-binding
MELISHRLDYNGRFDDKRLDRRAELLSNAIFMGRSAKVHAVTKSEAEQKGFYRFLSNERATEDHLIEEMTERCSGLVKGRDVLVIQDSSSIGLSHHWRHLQPKSGLGLVGNKQGIGFLTHVSMVIDAHAGTMLGYCDVQLWHRTKDKANNTTRIYKKQPIEQKESYKWLKADYQAKELLSDASSITIIQDREGDIFDQFSLIPDQRTHLLIRSRNDRNLADGGKLYARLQSAAILGSYTVDIPGDIRRRKKKRTAKVTVKCVPVTLSKPSDSKDRSLPDSVSLYAIEVRETNSRGKQKLCWRLLTTEKTETFEQAVVVINRYKQRWFIEQLFRLLKNQGYRIESTELETGWAIRKMFVLILNAALRIMQLYLSFEKEGSQPVKEVFSKNEIRCLELIEQKQFGNAKIQNPHNKDQLTWATWIIARLAGWKGNPKQRRPGPILLKSGLEKFDMMYQGWLLIKNET